MSVTHIYQGRRVLLHPLPHPISKARIIGQSGSSRQAIVKISPIFEVKYSEKIHLLLKYVKNLQVREFWFFEFEKYSAWLRSEAISPILNKMSQFLTSEPLRNIVSQKKSALDFRKIMDEGKVLVVNLSKGKIGEDNCALLGAMIVTKIQLAALSRTDIPEHRRRSFYLFVDEVHSFMTLSFADALSEARKYGLSLVLAHQYIEQLDPKIRAAIFGNIGTLISFRVGAEDAKLLAREFHPVFSETDLISLSNHHIYLKLMIDGHTSEPFSAVTLPPLASNESFKREIISLSRASYGKVKDRKESQIGMESQTENIESSRQQKLIA